METTSKTQPKKVNYPFALGVLESRVKFMHFTVREQLRKAGKEVDKDVIDLIERLCKEAAEGALEQGARYYENEKSRDDLEF